MEQDDGKKMVYSLLIKHAASGLRSLRRRPLRSVLTMLGIVFGVGAVVAMLAIGEGASHESQERIKSLGSRNIIVRSVKPAEEDKGRGSGSAFSSAIYGITEVDLRRIAATVPGIEQILPVRETRQDIWNGPRKMDGIVKGTLPEYPQVTDQKVKRGRFLTPLDVTARAPVCVIGSEVRKNLFPFEDPIGRTVKVGRNYYQVVGEMEPQATATAETELITGVNATVIIPLSTANERFGKTILKVSAGSVEAETVELHQLFIKIREIEEVIPVSEMIQTLIVRFHRKPDFEMIVPLKLLEEIRRNARMFSLVLGMIAAISLLVGGIGIMNIMLANVTERTREIGIRRALGAKKRDIVAQFLSETIVLSLTGGVLGLGLGIVIPVAVNLFTGMKVIFTPWSLGLAFSISALVGLIFGIYPAYRAADMNPIEALRHT